MNLYFVILIKSVLYLTLVLQLYLLWLILRKTTSNMASFRFALLMLLQNELFFTFHVGILVQPEMVVPHLQGAMVNGPLQSMAGPISGRVAFTMAIFFGAGVFSNQIYCLIFRYTAVQQRFINLNKRFNRWPIRLLSMIIGHTNMTICAYFSFYCIASPEEISTIVQSAIAICCNTSLTTMEELQLLAINQSTLLLLSKNLHDLKMFALFVMGGFLFASVLSICISMRIYLIIQANARSFSAYTFKLHRQLTLLLIIQFCLPILFLGVPAIWMTFAVVFNAHVSKAAGDFALLLGCLFALANSVVIIAFVAPYRKHTLKLAKMALFWPCQGSKQQQQQQQEHQKQQSNFRNGWLKTTTRVHSISVSVLMRANGPAAVSSSTGTAH